MPGCGRARLDEDKKTVMATTVDVIVLGTGTAAETRRLSLS
jgi:hypothetical protein